MRTVKDIDRSKYTITEQSVHMKSDIHTVVQYTPIFTDEGYAQTKKAINSELYDIFKKYVQDNHKLI